VPWKRLVQAGLELYDKPADKVALLTQYLEITREAEKYAQDCYDAERLRIGELHRARYERLDAEIRLLRAKREADKAKGK
jgi:outer membrane protein TolC